MVDFIKNSACINDTEKVNLYLFIIKFRDNLKLLFQSITSDNIDSLQVIIDDMKSYVDKSCMYCDDKTDLDNYISQIEATYNQIQNRAINKGFIVF